MLKLKCFFGKHENKRFDNKVVYPNGKVEIVVITFCENCGKVKMKFERIDGGFIQGAKI